MVKNRIERKFTYPVQLTGAHLDFIDLNHDFSISKFVRQKLDEYIKFTNEVKQLEAT